MSARKWTPREREAFARAFDKSVERARRAGLRDEDEIAAFVFEDTKDLQNDAMHRVVWLDFIKAWVRPLLEKHDWSPRDAFEHLRSIGMI